jgi:hypothetical protein
MVYALSSNLSNVGWGGVKKKKKEQGDIKGVSVSFLPFEMLRS